MSSPSSPAGTLPRRNSMSSYFLPSKPEQGGANDLAQVRLLSSFSLFLFYSPDGSEQGENYRSTVHLPTTTPTPPS